LNSLLEATLDYEKATKAPPIITEETTSSIEEIIKKRIQEELWDDVIRKKEPKKKFKPKLDMEEFQEKSKIGLGEVMEKEYLKQAMGVSDPDKLDGEHKEILILFKKICIQLDALSNFHYTPKPIIPEVTIRPNVSALEMEEIIPASVSVSNVLAPEEIFNKKKRELKGDSEKITGRKKSGKKIKEIFQKEKRITKRSG